MREQPTLLQNNDHFPLAARMRPRSLQDFAGQKHLLDPEKPLFNFIQVGKIPSMILFGPPGCGKTSLARLIATQVKARFRELSAVTSSVKEVRQEIEQAGGFLRNSTTRTILFIDEIHRFNKSQQALLLPAVEDGTVSLMGATTENPSFYVIAPLRSRCHLFAFHPLTAEEVMTKLQQAMKEVICPRFLTPIILTDRAASQIARFCNGDLRLAFNILESSSHILAVSIKNTKKNLEKGKDTEQSGQKNQCLEIDETIIGQIVEKGAVFPDKDGNSHYDHASAFQKSMRGSDVDATIYYLAKMLSHGEDPRFIARRMMVCAAEDVGLKDPFALTLAVAASEAVEKLGLPEGRIPLVEAAIYIAQAPKSNLTIRAIDKALEDIEKNGKNFPVPLHLRSTAYKDAKSYGHGVGYMYSHNDPERKQRFLPLQLENNVYYEEEPKEVASVSQETFTTILTYLQAEDHKLLKWEHDAPEDQARGDWLFLNSEVMAAQLNLPKKEIKRGIMELVRKKKIEIRLHTLCRILESK